MQQKASQRDYKAIFPLLIQHKPEWHTSYLCWSQFNLYERFFLWIKGIFYEVYDKG